MSDLLKTTQHLLAGNAVFTVRHAATGERYTYRFRTVKSGAKAGKTFAELLIGADNTKDYREIGEIRDGGEIKLAEYWCGGTPPVSVALAQWIAKLAATGGAIPEGLELHHAGQCLRCGRMLTVPYPDNPFRPYGLGPECGSK